MKIAYLECATGISGDMTLAALLDAGVDEAAVRAGLASLKLPGVQLIVREVMKGCFRAKSIRVEHPEQHAHRHLADIVELIQQAEGLSPRQREIALQIFSAVGEAEARVHGTTIDKIHFHEVGAIDSIVDIVGVAIGFDLLGADQIVCGPLPTGRGEVRIDHGICAVPTPGTAELLKGIPLRDLPIVAELTTPTGAAIVKVLADRFGALPEMSLEVIGSGAGTLELPDRANILRLFVGQSVSQPQRDHVVLLETNLDDVSGEVIGYTKQRLLEAGALDVFSVAAQMKKNRPGVVLTVIGPPQKQEELEAVLFQETGTLGVRRQWIERATRPRSAHTVLTTFGPVLGKVAWQAGGRAEFAPEFDDCARIAQLKGISLREVYRSAVAAFDQEQTKCLVGSPEQILTSTQPESSDSHAHDHSHDHSHSHAHDHDHNHSHDHSHDHDHEH